MQKNLIHKIIIASLIVFMIVFSFACSYAVTPDMIDGKVDGAEIDLSFIDTIENFIKVVGTFLAVGILMVIGIKYVTGSVEEKANYKKTMIPYIIRMLYIIWSSIYRTSNKEFI